MTKIKDISNHLENIAPLHLQESYDNAGLITGSPNSEVKGILISLDATEAVVEEAKTKNCNLVVSHHPIVFFGLKKINGKNYVERTVIQSIKNDIALYAIHTNLDNIYTGVNAKIAEKLGLENCQILKPKDPENAEIGSGMLGKLPQSMSEERFFSYLKEQMQLQGFRHTPTLGRAIEKVAVCGGAGSFLLSQAVRKKADVFITADYKYHEFFDAENHLVIADIGHYESEVFTKELLFEMLTKQFPNLPIHISEVNTNPVEYYF